MKILVMGGTLFLGRHLVDAALARGHEVTLFNRGRTNPALFGDRVSTIVGDRNSDLERLSHLHFDVCVDTSAYHPRQVSTLMEQLKGKLAGYVLVSSISVYARFLDNLTEAGQLAELPNDADPDVYSDEYYGEFKVLCERSAESAMPGKVLHVRSGLIVGPHDPTHRFTYWPVRVSQGGRMLAPAAPNLPVQIVDARDQSEWILDCLEHGTTGAFNVTSPTATHTLGELISVSADVTQSHIEPVWVPSDFLLAHQVAPWMGLPLWLPEPGQNMMRVNVDAATSKGFRNRPLRQTVTDTIAWYEQQPQREWPAGISVEQERKILKAFQTP